MALMNVNDCYKKGLFGTTIFDVSNKINSVDDVISWLEYMYNLATYTTEGKSEHKGMRRLLDVIEKNRVLELKYDSTELSVKIKAIGALVTSLNYIEEGSKKAWVGRTKQKGFQNTLKKCQTVAQKALNKVSDEYKDKLKTEPANVQNIVTSIIEIKEDVIKKSSDVNKVEKQVNEKIVKNIKGQNIKINNEEKDKTVKILKENKFLDEQDVKKIEIALEKKVEEPENNDVFNQKIDKNSSFNQIAEWIFELAAFTEGKLRQMEENKTKDDQKKNDLGKISLAYQVLINDGKGTASYLYLDNEDNHYLKCMYATLCAYMYMQNQCPKTYTKIFNEFIQKVKGEIKKLKEIIGKSSKSNIMLELYSSLENKIKNQACYPYDIFVNKGPFKEALGGFKSFLAERRDKLSGDDIEVIKKFNKYYDKGGKILDYQTK